MCQNRAEYEAWIKHREIETNPEEKRTLQRPPEAPKYDLKELTSSPSELTVSPSELFERKDLVLTP